METALKSALMELSLAKDNAYLALSHAKNAQIKPHVLLVLKDSYYSMENVLINAQTSPLITEENVLPALINIAKNAALLIQLLA